METVFTVLQISFLFLFIDASYSDLCKSTEGELECCPEYSWNRIEERCKKCDAGKFGPRCEKDCPYPYYGNLCVFRCDCNENLCIPTDGCSDKTNTSTTSSQKPRMLSLSSSNAERKNPFNMKPIDRPTSHYCLTKLPKVQALVKMVLNIYMYFIFKTVSHIKKLYFLLVTGLYAITKETSTPNVSYNDDHTYTDEETQHHEEYLRSQYIQFVTVSLAVLVVVMCIIYVGTKSIVRRRLSTDTTC
ncbi:uncharacterized protein LOC128185357 [Crassostrea angulata]|uniref:uncharacterized protein LOC128185357 n=1 Tax=Magallana angulata TaxID=2784310 RepID=UPI0022B1D52E|nr:uncharacterized protein LOC128185357 [Crassostrea angulata]